VRLKGQAMLNWSDFQVLCEHELELCKVHEGQTVVVLSQGDDRMQYADAFISAARRLGAESYNVRLGDTSSALNGPAVSQVGINPLRGNQGAIDALKHADLVIDLIFLLWSKEQHEIQDAGARILTVIEEQTLLKQMFPTQAQRERCEISAALLRNAKQLRVTSKAGTDVSYELGRYKVVDEYGFTDQPGRWDSWPAGFVFTAGVEHGINGRVLIDRGDIFAMPFRGYVQSPIELVVEHGRVVRISGGVDAELMRDYLERMDDPRGYSCSHIGWGVNENVRWSSMASTLRSYGQEARAFYGNVMFATGPNLELGGNNDTPAHIDIPMRNCSLFLDDKPVLIDGEFVVPELKLPAGHRD
jgi:2,5-dihydroxypyridine 5,6-dioxygenase